MENTTTKEAAMASEREILFLRHADYRNAATRQRAAERLTSEAEASDGQVDAYEEMLTAVTAMAKRLAGANALPQRAARETYEMEADRLRASLAEMRDDAEQRRYEARHIAAYTPPAK